MVNTSWVIFLRCHKTSRQGRFSRDKTIVFEKKDLGCWWGKYDNHANYIDSYLANGQPFKLLGITYFVGKIKFKLFFQGPLAK